MLFSRGERWHGVPGTDVHRDMENIRERLSALLPKLPVPRAPGLPHPAVAKLLKRDDEKRERQLGLSYVSSWDTPLYDTPSRGDGSGCCRPSSWP